MAETPKKLIVDLEKGTQEYVDLTPQEIAEMDQRQAEAAEQQLLREQDAAAKEALKESAKAKLVAGEPLTEDEAAVLVIQWYAYNNIPLSVRRPSYQHNHC